MNPRETFIDGIFDEFAADQRLPIENNSNSKSSISSNSSSLLSSSSHYSSSTHSILSVNSTSSMAFTSSISLFTTKTEDEQLNDILNRIHDAYIEYIRVHEMHNILSSNPNVLPSNANGLFKFASVTQDELTSCFKEVPDIFFRPEFTLKNMEIFNQALNIHNYVKPHKLTTNNEEANNKNGKNKSDDEDKSNYLILEKLSKVIPSFQEDVLKKYLDTIELVLLNSIWIRSPSFFRVLDDIRELQLLVKEAYNYIIILRKKYQSVNEKIALTTLRIPKLYIRQNNENILYEKMLSIQKVMAGRIAVQNLLDCEDYLTAIEIINEMKTLHHEELEGLHCMKSIGIQLDKYDSFISEVMCNKFVSLSIQWEIDDQYNDMSQNGNNKSFHGTVSSIDDDSSLSTPVLPSSRIINKDSLALDQLIQALLTVNKLKGAITLYKGRLSDSVRLIVRTCVLEYLNSFDPSLITDALESSDTSSNTPGQLK